MPQISQRDVRFPGESSIVLIGKKGNRDLRHERGPGFLHRFPGETGFTHQGQSARGVRARGPDCVRRGHFTNPRGKADLAKAFAEKLQVSHYWPFLRRRGGGHVNSVDEA